MPYGVKHSDVFCIHTLDLGIDVRQGINVGSGKFGKMNKQNVQTYVEKISNFEIFVAHGCRAWKNIQN